jgi:hypothetical protein
VNKNFAAATDHAGVSPNMDISGLIHITSAANYQIDTPRIKLVSGSIANNMDIPLINGAQTANEIRGVSTSTINTSGFLRLTAQAATKSCIDLIGDNTIVPNLTNSVRISTSGTDRMLVNSVGNVGIGTTNPAVRLDVSGIMRASTGLKLGNDATTTMTGSNSTLDVQNTVTARARFTSGTNNLTVGIHSNTTSPSESFFFNESNTPMIFGTNNTERMRILADGKVGIGTNTPTVALDVVGAANVSNYLSVGSGGSGSGATTSILPNAFYVRTGGSNWRDYIPLLVADPTTNLQKWGGPDSQWYDVTSGAPNEIAKQYSYFAAYWLNANRAVQGTSFSVQSYASNDTYPPAPTSRGLFTFTATVVTNGVVTAYEGRLSAFNGSFYSLTPQQDGIDAGVARRSLSNRTLLMGGSVETGYLSVSGVAQVPNPTQATHAATKGYVDGAIPIGGIIMWSGTIATIPSNWKICDGSNNTPDLRNRFVIGAIVDSNQRAMTNLETTLYGDVTQTQTGGTKDAVVVAHSHSATSNDVTPPTGITELGLLYRMNEAGTGGNFHRAAVGNTPYYTGASGSHRHTITVAEQGESGTNKNLPPYYALAFIMRIS